MNTTTAEAIAWELVRRHAPGWTVTWGQAKSQFGQCQYGPKIIKLSRPLTALNSEATFRWVVLHEIGHVLAGPAAKHGPKFRLACHTLGIQGDRCWTAGGNTDLVRIEGNVLGQCKGRCGYTVTMHRITHTSWRRSICPTCSNRRTRYWVYLDWTRNGQPVACPKKPAPRKRRSRRRSYAADPWSFE